MHAMVLNRIGEPPVRTELPDREPGPGEIRVAVGACGVWRIDLHVVYGETGAAAGADHPRHEIVGRIRLPRTGCCGKNGFDGAAVPVTA